MSSLSYLARLLTFAAILVAGGVAVFRWFVVRRASFGTDDVNDLTRRAAAFGVVASLTLLPAAFVRLVVQVDEMRFPDDPWLPIARTMIAATPWGWAWIAQLVLAIALAFMFMRARRATSWQWRVAALLALALCVTPSIASHAAAARRFGSGAIVADALHVVGAATWLGTLAVLVVAVGGRVTRLMPLVRAFSPIALTGAAIVATSGLVSSLAHLSTWSELVATLYGNMVMVKVASVVAVASCGFVNWRILTPKGAARPRALHRGVVMELAVAVLVVVVTAFLVVTPPPAE